MLKIYKLYICKTNIWKKSYTDLKLDIIHNRLNMHLHKLGLHNSGLCNFCEEPETVKHYLLIV